MTIDHIPTSGRSALERPKREFRYSSTAIPDLVALLDAVSITIAATVCYLVIRGASTLAFDYYFFCTAFVAAISYLLLRRSGLYEIDAIMRPISRSDLIIVSIVSAFLFFLTIAFSLKVSDIYSRLWIWSFGASAVGLVTLNRVLFSLLMRRMSAQRVVGRTIAVLGTGPQAERFLQRVEAVKPYFTDVIGAFALEGDARCDTVGPFKVLGSADDLLAAVRQGRIDDVIVAMPWNADEQLSQVVEALKELPINVYISTDLIGYQLQFRPAFGQFNELPLFEVVQRPISGWSSLFKAIEDYFLASLLLILLSPLLILIAIAIKIDSPGPVFFMQKRLGFNNQVFEIYKFRSMYHRERPEPETHLKQASKDDPRVTRVGRIIRRTSLDELPQLLNVLDGTMSLVGPRPHALRHNEDYGRQIRGYFARHKVKPGITGWAQVNGLRGETETLSKMEARVAYDIYYAENWSLLFDMRILFMTAIVVLFQKSAY